MCFLLLPTFASAAGRRGGCADSTPGQAPTGPLRPCRASSQPDNFRTASAVHGSPIGLFLDRCPARRHGHVPLAARETGREASTARPASGGLRAPPDSRGTALALTSHVHPEGPRVPE